MLVSFLPTHLTLQIERDENRDMVFLFEIYPVHSPQSDKTPSKQAAKQQPQAQRQIQNQCYCSHYKPNSPDAE